MLHFIGIFIHSMFILKQQNTEYIYIYNSQGSWSNYFSTIFMIVLMGFSVMSF